MIERPQKAWHKRANAASCWEGPRGVIHVEVEKTHSVRDIRGTLLTLAQIIGPLLPNHQAVCVVTGTRLTVGRLNEELMQFRQVIRPALANRVHFLIGSDDGHGHRTLTFSGSMEEVPVGFLEWLQELIAHNPQIVDVPPLSPRQMVVAGLAQLRLQNASPVTVKFLQEKCRASYPTVAAVLKVLANQGLLENTGARGVRLRYLTSGEWMDLARDHARQRKVHLFTDPTGHSSPSRMVNRLVQLQASAKLAQTVRVGGVMGAAQHFPELDITAALRLDLCVDRAPSRIAAILDAGLIPKTKPGQRVAVAVHVTGFPSVDACVDSPQQGPWASELDCLADLLEMGYEREASEMAQHIESSNKVGKQTT